MKNTAGDLAPPCFRVTPWKKPLASILNQYCSQEKKVKSHFTINKGYCRRSYTSFIFKPICRVTLHAGLRHAPSLQYAFSPHWLHQRNHQSSTGGSTGAGSLGPTGGTTGSTGFTGAGSLGPAGGSTGGFTGAGCTICWFICCCCSIIITVLQNKEDTMNFCGLLEHKHLKQVYFLLLNLPPQNWKHF